MNTWEQEKLEEFITELQDILATKTDDCGRINRVYHRMDTGDARPIRHPLEDSRRPTILKWRDAEGHEGKRSDRKAKHLLAFARRAVKKKKRDLRFCIDYRKLNVVKKTDCFALRGIDETLDTLAEANWSRLSTWRVAASKSPCTPITKRISCSPPLKDSGSS
jgi:hypothetical protein